MRPFFLRCTALALLGLFAGCGQIINKDNIRIARVDGEYITRGDLAEVLRNMSDKERPTIRNKGDLLRALNQHIDTMIKLPLGRQLAQEGKINLPREAAREAFFRQAGDDEQILRSIWEMEIPAEGQITPLMKVYDLTPQSLRTRKDFIEQETDFVHERLLGDQAVAFLAAESFQKGELKMDPAALEREYNVRKDELQSYESMRFLAIRFPDALPDAAVRAANVRKRIDAGESFDALLEEVLAENREYAIESDIENNPTLERFRGFWSTASGAQQGQIVGPVFLPEYQQVNPQTQQATVMPASWLVLQVLEVRPARTLTLEEATPMLAAPLLVAEQMKRLREERGVEIYEDQLPDPAGFAGPRA